MVETDECGKEVDAQNAHDEVIVIEENRNNEASSSSSGSKVVAVDKNASRTNAMRLLYSRPT